MIRKRKRTVRCDCKPTLVGKQLNHKNECALFKPDWDRKCEVCGASPIVPLSMMCGPCTWGEAETAGGNW